METNPAYGLPPRPTLAESGIYEQIDPEYVQDVRNQTPASVKDKPSKETNDEERKIKIMVATSLVAMIVALVMALLAIIIVAALYNPILNNSNQEVQLQFLRAQLENLREMLNKTELSQYQLLAETNHSTSTEPLAASTEPLATFTEPLATSTEPLATSTEPLATSTEPLVTSTKPPTTTEPPVTTESPPPIGTFENPASSCSDIPKNSPSGEYWIQTSSSNSPVQVYCDMNRTCTCSDTTGGWMRVANLDMTDPSQQCPDGFTIVTSPLRTCGRSVPIGCVSTTFPAHGIEYSQVCGRIIGYQYASPDAFNSFHNDNTLTIDGAYVDGLSLTHGQSPRQHIWTFAAALDETQASQYSCSCTIPELRYTGVVPPFIGQDYFCETGSRNAWQTIFYDDDPLWNGQGCGGTSTCCSFNNPPWFCKVLPQPTTDDIELRLCVDQNAESTPIEIIEIYVK